MSNKKKQTVLKKATKIVIGIIIITVVVILGIGTKFYLDVKSSVSQTYVPAVRTSNERVTSNLAKKEPFSILLLGIDSDSTESNMKGRSDTMIAATVNPAKEKTVVVSLPRDTYTDIIGYNTMDKMNHAYAFGGPGMSMDTVQNLLKLPINHYIAINMDGIKQLVDAVGDIQIKNKFEFTYGGVTFNKGVQMLNGDSALKYTRMRYDDPNGDYGRQERQRQVVVSLSKKIVSMQGALNYPQILKTVEGNITTDLSFDEIKLMVKNYQPAFKEMLSEQLKGEGFMKDGISYQHVDREELSRVQKLLAEELQ